MIPPYHWWRTVFFLIPAISVYTIVLGTVSLASALADAAIGRANPRWRRGRIAHGCARAWSRLILVTTGVRVTLGERAALDPHASYIFASNHQSIYDIPIVFASLPRQLRIIAKASLGHVPFLGWHLKWTGHLLVDRERPGPAVLKKMARLVADGASLIVFPEGTRSRDGVVAPFKGGLFLLAIDAGMPIVPVSIAHSRHVMLKGRLMTCPGGVTLTVHEPIPTAGLQRGDARALAERVREIVVTEAA
ncbi:MAG: 1-acyl-sn-glycerol-3-phosphate acyltransferase [Acidobacteria bacterium]|nr:1-acyl-sn-glycerol-3-phosphate acyltransferase [Acidobacteriota bacterium]